MFANIELPELDEPLKVSLPPSQFKKLVIFDLDDTLVRTNPQFFPGSQLVCVRYKDGFQTEHWC